jgi:hypothetical protein
MNVSLDKVNINDISPGLEVISNLGTFGKVSEVIKEEDNLKKEAHQRVRYDTIKIVWDNGNKSTVFHMDADRIAVRNQMKTSAGRK